MKVYCCNCKWLRSWPCFDRETFDEQNANNDCFIYKRKWWRFWMFWIARRYPGPLRRRPRPRPRPRLRGVLYIPNPPPPRPDAASSTKETLEEHKVAATNELKQQEYLRQKEKQADMADDKAEVKFIGREPQVRWLGSSLHIRPLCNTSKYKLLADQLNAAIELQDECTKMHGRLFSLRDYRAMVKQIEICRKEHTPLTPPPPLTISRNVCIITEADLIEVIEKKAKEILPRPPMPPSASAELSESEKTLNQSFKAWERVKAGFSDSSEFSSLEDFRQGWKAAVEYLANQCDKPIPWYGYVLFGILGIEVVVIIVMLCKHI